MSSSFESIAAQAEFRSSSVTWRIHSLHVEADLLSSDGNLQLESLDWMDHQSPLDSLPITPPPLQQQLDSISQLSHEIREPSFPAYWGRKYMHSYGGRTARPLRKLLSFWLALLPRSEPSFVPRQALRQAALILCLKRLPLGSLAAPTLAASLLSAD